MPHSAALIRKQSNPYSASDKIAELGLGAAMTKAKPSGSPTFSMSAAYPEKSKGGLGQAVKKTQSNESVNIEKPKMLKADSLKMAQAVNEEEDEDSDDLF